MGGGIAPTVPCCLTALLLISPVHSKCVKFSTGTAPPQSLLLFQCSQTNSNTAQIQKCLCMGPPFLPENETSSYSHLERKNSAPAPVLPGKKIQLWHRWGHLRTDERTHQDETERIFTEHCSFCRSGHPDRYSSTTPQRTNETTTTTATPFG